MYYQDAAGRPSTDPDLYSRAQAGTYGERLALADGFDGSALANGFSFQGRGQVAAGSVILAAGAALALPPVKTGRGISVTSRLGAASSRTAVLHAQWEGSSTQAAEVPLTADGPQLSFRIAPSGLSITVPAPQGERTVNLPSPVGSDASLLLKIGNPPDARSDLVIESILALASAQ